MRGWGLGNLEVAAAPLLSNASFWSLESLVATNGTITFFLWNAATFVEFGGLNWDPKYVKTHHVSDPFSSVFLTLYPACLSFYERASLLANSVNLSV